MSRFPTALRHRDSGTGAASLPDQTPWLFFDLLAFFNNRSNPRLAHRQLFADLAGTFALFRQLQRLLHVLSVCALEIGA